MSFLNAWEPIFELHRDYLLGFAFRLTGSLAEAQDVVQETFLRCADTDPSTVRAHRSWLTKVCSNVGLDHLKSAQKRREVYHGVWLPDALPDVFYVEEYHGLDSPERNLLLSESLTTSFLLLMDKLSPEERVIYLLTEIFDYSFKETAALLEKSEASCRKAAERARKSLDSHRTQPVSDPSTSAASVQRFFEFVKRGDQNELAKLLADNSEFWSDSGGKVPASPRVLNGKSTIARFFAAFPKLIDGNTQNYRIDFTPVNRRHGVVVSKYSPSGKWTYDTLFSLEADVSGMITRIYAQRNPDKLKALNDWASVDTFFTQVSPIVAVDTSIEPY